MIMQLVFEFKKYFSPFNVVYIVYLQYNLMFWGFEIIQDTQLQARNSLFIAVVYIISECSVLAL